MREKPSIFQGGGWRGGQKEWFCGKDVCLFEDSKNALFKQVKQTFKIDLRALWLAGKSTANPVLYHAGKAVYISESGHMKRYSMLS